MKDLVFEWDVNKEKINKRKHKVDFYEAATTFLDDDAILFDDKSHSINEERYLLIGISDKANILIVSHCYRKNDEVIRIISARLATNKEKEYYIENINGGII